MNGGRIRGFEQEKETNEHNRTEVLRLLPSIAISWNLDGVFCPSFPAAGPTPFGAPWCPRTSPRDLPAQSRLLPEVTPTSEALAPGWWGPRTVVRLPSSLNRRWRVENLLQGPGLVWCSLKTTLRGAVTHSHLSWFGPRCPPLGRTLPSVPTLVVSREGEVWHSPGDGTLGPGEGQSGALTPTQSRVLPTPRCGPSCHRAGVTAQPAFDE